MSKNSNTSRVLREIVSLEAWHDPFTVDYPTVEFFASIRFNTSRFGGESGDKIQFTLTLKNARLVVIPDESGILNIPNRHVRRDKRQVSVTSETTRASTQEISADASASAELSDGKPKTNVKLNAKAKAANSDGQTKTMKQSERGIISEHAKDGDQHSWLFSPAMGSILDGHGWPDESRILKLKHTIPTAIESEHFPPYVKVQVKCFANDLNIDKVQYLDKQNRDWLPFGNGKKLDLAKELIKEELQKEGLLDLSRNCAAPLTAYYAQKENDHGKESYSRI